MSPEYPHHPGNCWCVSCWNHAQRLSDQSRKAKKIDPIGQAKACDAESIEVWFEFYHPEAFK